MTIDHDTELLRGSDGPEPVGSCGHCDADMFEDDEWCSCCHPVLVARRLIKHLDVHELNWRPSMIQDAKDLLAWMDNHGGGLTDIVDSIIRADGAPETVE